MIIIIITIGIVGTTVNIVIRSVIKRFSIKRITINITRNVEKMFQKDIVNERLKFLNFCEHQKTWNIKEICDVLSLLLKTKSLSLKDINNFPEIIKSGIYAIYINNEQDENFLPCYIGKSDNILSDWLGIIEFIGKNVQKDDSNLPSDKFETKIITYLKENNLKIKDVHFVVLKAMANDEETITETENLIRKFETDKNGWN